MTCLRHGAIASHLEHGLFYCARCFAEALERAEAVEVERVIARIRWRIRTEFPKR